MLPSLTLKKNEERRIRSGHAWVYSNEIDTDKTPLKNVIPGQEVQINAYDQTPVGVGFVNPHSLIAVRIFSTNIKDRLDLDFITKKIEIAHSFRSRFFAKPYYRLIFGESDLLPGLIVDQFKDHLVVQINTAGMEAKKELIIAALRIVLPDTQSILFRNDSSARIKEGLEKEIVAGFGVPPQKILLEENNTAFFAPIWEGQKTGWFYDHRNNRLRLKDYVAEKKVLDVFSYLGAWGIQAALFGAQEVICLDSSPFASSCIYENAKLNNVHNKIKVLCDDAFDALKRLVQEKEKFDVVILDPPAFVKKAKDKKEGLIAYQRINELALKLLENDGILFSCSCSMHISCDELLHTLCKASQKSNSPLQILERGHQGPDHPIHPSIPETDYLKMLIGRKF